MASAAALDRYVAVLFARDALAFASKLSQGANDLRASLPRLDHSVDKTTFCRDIGIGELVAVVGHQIGSQLGCSFACLVELPPVQHIDRALGSHYRDFSAREGEIDIGPNVLD